MTTVDDLEHAPLIDALVRRSRSLDEQGKPHKGSPVDLIDLIREFSPQITQLRDEAIASELDEHSQFFWAHAVMLETTQKVLDSNGDEQAAAIIDGQRRMLLEMASKLGRRAAAVRGVTEDELRMRSVLLWPADQPAAEQAAAEQAAAAAEAGAEAAAAKVIPVLCVTCGVRVEVADDPDSILAYQNKHQGECPGATATPDGSDAA